MIMSDFGDKSRQLRSPTNSQNSPGVFRCALSFAVDTANAELSGLDSAVWKEMDYGDKWSKITLIRGNEIHPSYSSLPEIRAMVERLTTSPREVTLASLAPGGSTKVHRDVSGGAAMGVIRFHIALVTHETARMLVNGRDMHLKAGEVWILDTTYTHAVFNHGESNRIHLIVDAPRQNVPEELLPPRGIRTVLHVIAFSAIAVGTVLSGAIRRPRRTFRTVSDAVRIRILHKAPLEHSD